MPPTLPVPLPDTTILRSWSQQIAIEKADEMTYRSLAGAPYGGNFVTKIGEPRPRAFGGHVYAQAAYAASKTIPKGYFIHSITGYFTIIGLADDSFIYSVSVVRDGGNYIVRRVDVSQGLERSRICYTAICSFKKPEPKFLDIQAPRRNLLKEYSFLLEGKSVGDLPYHSKFKDLRTAYEKQEACITTVFPGLLTSILPFEKHHKSQKAIERKSLYIYSAVSAKESQDGSVKFVETEEEESNDLALQAAAHMYHSDRESVWSVVRQYELLGNLQVAASLSHTVTFHCQPDQLRFWDPKTKKRRWFFSETGSERVADGRVLHKGNIYDENGVHVATTLQDGAIRVSFSSDEELLKKQQELIDGPDAKL